MERKYFFNIDALRILLVIFIVYYHFIKTNYVQSYDLPLYKSLALNVGWTGSVCNATLFIISGYFLCSSFIRHQEPFLKFAIRKLIRFWPVLCFSVICMAILSCFHLFKFNIGQAFLNLCLITKGFGLSTTLSNTYISWFVCNLFWCSLFYYALYIVLKDKFKFNFIVSIITYFCMVLYINNPSVRDSQVIFNMFSKAFILSLGHVGLGILIHGFLNSVDLTKFKFNKFVMTIFEVALSSYLIHGCLIKKFTDNYMVIILAAAALFVLFLLNKGYLSSLLNHSIFANIGKYAFSIYIMQDVIFVFFKNYLWKQQTLAINHPILTISISILSSILLGVITYHFVENPCAKYLKKNLLDKYDNYIQNSEYR